MASECRDRLGQRAARGLRGRRAGPAAGAAHASRHDDAGLAQLIGLLRRYDVERVAMERPDGVLVERLLAAGLPLLAIHPNQVQAARDRYRAAAGKSDAFDAFVLAELARTDHHRFRLVSPDHDQTRALRAMTRARDDLVELKVAACQPAVGRARALLAGRRSTSSPTSASPIALAFLERYPSPRDANRLGPQRLAGFLARHRYSGRKRPHELLERLAQAPSVQLWRPRSRSPPRHRAGPGRRAAPPDHPDRRARPRHRPRASAATPTASSSGPASPTPAARSPPAQLVAEIGDRRDRYPSAESLIADAGQSPVAVESGKRKHAAFRHACDKRLRRAASVLADSSRHHNPWAADVYHRARQRGCDHPHAIRILGRAWLRVLWRCWHDHTPYDPNQHGGLQRLLTARG